MNRNVIASASSAGIRLFVAAIALGSLACSSSGVGDPCTPEAEFGDQAFTFNGDLRIDLNSVQCQTRVCLAHFFTGRVTCPFGNNNTPGKAGDKCLAAVGSDGTPLIGLYTTTGKWSPGGTDQLCCPIVGDLNQGAIPLPVKPQCSGRTAQDSVYCTCRCAVADGEDPSTANLCSCPDGYACTKLIDPTTLTGSRFPSGAQGSYCLKLGDKGSNFPPPDDARLPSKLADACSASCTPPGPCVAQ